MRRGYLEAYDLVWHSTFIPDVPTCQTSAPNNSESEEAKRSDIKSVAGIQYTTSWGRVQKQKKRNSINADRRYRTTMRITRIHTQSRTHAHTHRTAVYSSVVHTTSTAPRESLRSLSRGTKAPFHRAVGTVFLVTRYTVPVSGKTKRHTSIVTCGHEKVEATLCSFISPSRGKQGVASFFF